MHNKKTYIHVGHGKTGSSAIQSYCAQVRDVLSADFNISYPYHRSVEWAAQGKVSSGNGRLLLDSDHVIPQGLSLYSDETLFGKLRKDDVINIIERCLQDVVFICYTRDFLDHAASAWGQHIKRARYTKPYDFFLLKHYGGHLNKLAEWLDWQNELGFELRVFNYSRHKTSICEHFFKTGLELGNNSPTDSHAPPAHRVNRSLTLSEYELQRLFNVHFNEPTSSFVSDQLVNQLPNIAAEVPRITRDIYDIAVAKNLSVITKINEQLRPDEKIRVEPFNKLPTSDNALIDSGNTFSDEQLSIVVGSLAQSLLRPNIGRFDRIISHFEQGRPIHSDDAVYLLEALVKIQPDEPKWRERLQSLESLTSHRPTDESVFVGLLHKMQNIFWSIVRRLR